MGKFFSGRGRGQKKAQSETLIAMRDKRGYIKMVQECKVHEKLARGWKLEPNRFPVEA